MKHGTKVKTDIGLGVAVGERRGIIYIQYQSSQIAEHFRNGEKFTYIWHQTEEVEEMKDENR